MERGAERFFEALPIPGRRQGSQSEHLAGLFETVAEALQRNPHFLRILIVIIDLLENLNHADVGVAAGSAAPERQGDSSPTGAKRVPSAMPGRS